MGPRVPTDQRLAAGQLADLLDQSGTDARFLAEALPRPRAHTDAAGHRALGPLRPTRPLALRHTARAEIRPARMRITDSALRGHAFARRRLALSRL